MAFNLADMVAKRPKQIQEENSSDTVYRDVFKLIPSKANFYGVKPEKLQGLKKLYTAVRSDAGCPDRREGRRGLHNFRTLPDNVLQDAGRGGT